MRLQKNSWYKHLDGVWQKHETWTTNTDTGSNGVSFSSGVCMYEWMVPGLSDYTESHWSQESPLNIPLDRQESRQIHERKNWREWVVVRETWWQSTLIDQQGELDRSRSPLSLLGRINGELQQDRGGKEDRYKGLQTDRLQNRVKKQENVKQQTKTEQQSIGHTIPTNTQEDS